MQCRNGQRFVLAISIWHSSGSITDEIKQNGLLATPIQGPLVCAENGFA